MVRSRRKANKVFDQIPDLKSSEKAIEKLTQARISLLLNHPFFGNMASRFEMIESSEWLQTAATDGLNFYFNSEFVNKLDQKEVEFLFGHEVLHCCYEHIFRTDNRDKMIFNIACDYCVNRDLVHNNIGRKTTTVKCLFDKKFDDMSAEDVYEDLKKNNTPKELNILSESILDVHLDYSPDSSAYEGFNSEQKTFAQKDAEIRDQIWESMLMASSIAGNKKTPKSVLQIIKKITKPQLDWRKILRQTLMSQFKDDMSWMKTSRKAWHIDATLPGLVSNKQINVVVALDSSGSISEDVASMFLNEIKEIICSFSEFKLHIFCFDTSIHRPAIITQSSIGDIDEYQIIGKGGTDYSCIFRYLTNESLVPDQLIIFTDGYPQNSDWGYPNFCETLFVINRNTNIVAPYGITTYIDEHPKRV